jgi:hypothetical protein
VGNDGEDIVGTHGFDAGRHEDFRANEFGVGFAGDGFDDGAEQDVAVGGIERVGAGLEQQGILGEDLEARGGAGVVARVVVVGGAIVANAGLVAEQLADGDGPLFLGVFRQVLLNRSVEPQLAHFDQTQDGHGGERLGNRGQAEERAGRRGHIVFNVGLAPGAGPDGARPVPDGDGDGGRGPEREEPGDKRGDEVRLLRRDLGEKRRRGRADKTGGAQECETAGHR